VHYLDAIMYPNLSVRVIIGFAVAVCAANLLIYVWRWCRRCGRGSELAGSGAGLAALLLVDVEIDVLRDRTSGAPHRGALRGFDGGLMGKVVAGVGAHGIESCRPFCGIGDKFPEGFANIGVGRIVSVEVVLELVAEVGEFIKPGAD